MKCPQCNHKFNPFKSLQISRWSSITCPDCSMLLNRNLDLQFWLVCGGIATVFIIIAKTNINPLLVFLVLIPVGALIDGLTIKLVPAKKQYGIRKILGRKTEQIK